MTASTRRAALSAILAAPLTGGAVMALPSAAAKPQSDLAEACLWAVQHRAWIDDTAAREPWSDDRLDHEISKVDVVFTRAIEEPSVTFQDLAAKAALALEDYERFTATQGDDHDDGVQIVHTVLREVIKLCA